jgi:hypothetical protein
MKKEAKILAGKAIASLIISTEHFNRPSDTGRIESVLILMDHAFEMLLKAAILHKGGRIREPDAKQTIGFDHCVRVGLSDGKVKFLTDEDALTLQSINSLRDAAQHHILDISEQLLYIQCQAGLSLFRKLLTAVFGKDLRTELPARVLPLSTLAAVDLATLFDTEIEEIRKLLKPGTRRRTEALAKIRALAIVEGAIGGEHIQPGQKELTELSQGIKAGKNWETLFPGVSVINITSSGEGPTLNLRITKKEGVPVELVKEGTPGASTVAIKRVNELDYYNLGTHDLAQKAGISNTKILAVIEHLSLKQSSDFYKDIQIGRQHHNRYSEKALQKIMACVAADDLDQIWAKYSKRPRKKPR